MQTLALIIFASVNIPLALAMYINNPKSWTNKLFSLLIIVLTIYLVVNGQVYEPYSYDTRLLFARFIMANAAILNLMVFLFLSTFPSKTLTLKKRTVYILGTITGLLSVISFTPFIFKEIVVSADNVVTPEPGLLMPLFGLHTLGLIFAGFIMLVKRFRVSSQLDKNRIRYVILAFALLFFLILVFNFLFPVVLKIGAFVPLLPFYLLIFLAIVSYAILRHRLVEIRLIVARSVVFSLAIVVIAVFYVTALYVIGNSFFGTVIDIRQIILSIFLTLVAAFSLPSLRNRIQKLTSNFLFKDNYDSSELLTRLTKRMAETLDLNDLLDNLSNELRKTMKMENITFILNKDDQIKVFGEKLDFSRDEFKQLIKEKVLITVEDVTDDNIEQILKKYSLSLVVPLSTNESGYFGLISFGPKSSGEIYNEEDLRLLSIFGQQASVAIENSQSYEQIKEFALTLESEVEKATKELKIANDKLTELDKRKDEFLSVAAHELRAPMTAIKGYLSMISDGDAGNLTSEAKDFVNEAILGNERLIRLVNNLLNISRIEEGRLTYTMGNIELSKVVNTVVDDYKHQSEEKGLKMSVEISNDIKDKVYVDQDRIYEVVSNLISNSVKYTDKGEIIVRLFNKSDNVCFEVKDTGPGISEDESKKLFQKFYRTQSSEGKQIGTGLGLYISKLLIEKFGGTIGCDSETGKGSTFWFTLPVKKSD